MRIQAYYHECVEFSCNGSNKQEYGTKGYAATELYLKTPIGIFHLQYNLHRDSFRREHEKIPDYNTFDRCQVIRERAGDLTRGLYRRRVSPDGVWYIDSRVS